MYDVYDIWDMRDYKLRRIKMQLAGLEFTEALHYLMVYTGFSIKQVAKWSDIRESRLIVILENLSGGQPTVQEMSDLLFVFGKSLHFRIK